MLLHFKYLNKKQVFDKEKENVIIFLLSIIAILNIVINSVILTYVVLDSKTDTVSDTETNAELDSDSSNSDSPNSDSPDSNSSDSDSSDGTLKDTNTKETIGYKRKSISQMIASSAETEYMVKSTLGTLELESNPIKCSKVFELPDGITDENCSIEFSNSGAATVSIVPISFGEYSGCAVTSATRVNAIVTGSNCEY